MLDGGELAQRLLVRVGPPFDFDDGNKLLRPLIRYSYRRDRASGDFLVDGTTSSGPKTTFSPAPSTALTHWVPSNFGLYLIEKECATRAATSLSAPIAVW